MIDDLRKNIETEISILKEIAAYDKKLDEATTPQEKKLINDAISALSSNIKTINKSVPKLLKNVSLAKRLPAKSEKTGLERITAGREKKIDVTLGSGDKEKFLHELNISQSLIKKLKKGRPKEIEEERIGEYKKASGYLRLANKVFGGTSRRLIGRGYFKYLAGELKKANIDILFQTYVSMMIFTTFLSIFVGLALSIGLILSGFGMLKVIWLIVAVPVVVFMFLYRYPSSEKKAIAINIERELPFAVIHMSAISGSGIEPTKIFGIIGLGREYPFLKKEIRKVLNQINLYGYDLVTALNNVSKTTPSTKLAELFAGLSATISSGGDLTDFFDKRAETLLTSYRIEREKFAKIAETFMDIYISVVIATPMILLLILVMISVSGIDIGFSPTQISFIIIFLIALINIIFLGVLQVKQPSY